MKKQDFDKIEAYLNGEMSEAETQLFDKEIAQSKELAACPRSAFGLPMMPWELMIEDNLRAELNQWRAEEARTTKVCFDRTKDKERDFVAWLLD